MNRARVRAALIAAVLAVNALNNLPFTSLDDKDLKNPIARQELKGWSELLAGIGVERSPDQLAQDAMRYGNGLAEGKKALLKPFRPAFRLTGTGQAWGLFTYPNTFPHRLHVEVREGAEWRLVYRALDPEARWMEAEFRFRRVRGVYDDNAWKARRSYQNFANWVAREAFEDFPDSDAVKVYFLRSRAWEIGEAPDPQVDVRLERVIER